jgi:hypothetical protein
MASRRRRAALVGNGAPVGVRRRLEAGEHKQAPRKLSRRLIGAMGARWRLSTARPSGGGWRSLARVGKPMWRLKGLIERLQSFTGSRGNELRGRRGARTAEVNCPR